MACCTEKPFAILTVAADVDLLQWAVFAVAFLVRVYCLHYPSAVIFDEQVQGTFASYYLRRSFFLDGSPPLSAQFAAVPALLAGFDGSFFNFTRIGTEYPAGVPFVAMRAGSCLVGSLLVPLAYGVLTSLRVDRCLAAAGALALAVEPSLVLQSRLIAPESLLLTCCFACLLCLLRARWHPTTIATPAATAAATFAGPCGPAAGFPWLMLCGILGGLAVSTRFIGFFTLLLAAVVALADYWSALANLTLSAAFLLRRLAVIVFCLFLVPAAVYTSVWWVHVTALSRALPHAAYRLSSPFVASLEGGVSLITGGQPKEVAFGSVLTLRHARGTSCWLHSHRDLYPLTYADGRGSSYQQQVTCYPFKDRNNWWIVKQPVDDDDGVGPLHVDAPPRLVRHGDVIELLHGSTLRKLNSHNVAAPLSVDHQEVSGYIDYNVSMAPHTEWRVDIVNRLTDDDVWQALFSEVRLIHVHSSQALSISGLVLPEWGSLQYEVVTERYHEVPATVWSVEEHKYLSDPAASGDVARQVGRAELLPTASSSYGFWSKLIEIHTKLFADSSSARSGLAGSHDHRFRSAPVAWPLGLANVVYWVHNSSDAQIHLVANPVVWWPAAAAVLVMSAAHVIIAVRKQVSSRDNMEHTATTAAGRPCDLFEESCCCCSGAAEAPHFRRLLLAGGYAAHYVPFFLTDDVLFLYCYLPSLVYAVLALVAGVDSLVRCFPGCRSWLRATCVAWVACVVAVSLQLSPLVYGSSVLPPDQWRLYEKMLGWDYIERH